MKTYLFNPYTGTPRQPSDIASDPQGLLIVEPGAPIIAAERVEPVASGVTEAMISAYLNANKFYWECVDTIPPKLGTWRNGKPREATRVGLEAALATAPALAAPAAAPTAQPLSDAEILTLWRLHGCIQPQEPHGADHRVKFARAIEAAVRSRTAPAAPSSTAPEALPLPVGWKLVPITPTPEMLDKGAQRYAMSMQYVRTAEQHAHAVYHDMLAAAPTAPAEQGKEGL